MFEAITFPYGSVTLATFVVLSFLGGRAERASKTQKSTWLREAQHTLWSLDDEGLLPGLRHDFLTLSGGPQLHYVHNACAGPATQLVVFLHGFPDSWAIYKRFLGSSALQVGGVQLVAVDLPGCGGSDDLKRYGADEVLNATVDAVAQLKNRFLAVDGSRCALVGHDWGGVIAFRIAAETVGLIDRVVVVNTTYVRHSDMHSGWTPRHC
ncbi:hypothetical protein LTR53_015900 [Teratosphaeriaceae sp. CCFEE 6253]|nr:hypothetical protein LTR53_015900 [Teratosphaeriaceae sp. CCFEE 6253]